MKTISLRVIHWVALILVIIGALNWGMIGFFQINVITLFFGGTSTAVSRIIYALVGLAGIWAFALFRIVAICDLERRK